MQFLVKANDGKDAEALNRRMAVRPAHLAGAEKMRKNGTLLLGAAMLDEGGKMVGSIMILNMKDRQEVDKYLAEEPYVTGNVWQEIEIQPLAVAAHYFPDTSGK